MTLILKRFLGMLILLVVASYLVTQSNSQPVASSALLQQDLAGPPGLFGGP